MTFQKVSFALIVTFLVANLLLTSCQILNDESDVSQSNTQTAATLSDDDVEHFLDRVETAQDSKDGPVKIEIIGDTAHLFADEDFEKKEVVLLHDENGTNETDNNNNNKTNSEGPSFEQVKPEMCSKSNLTVYRDFNTVQLVNGSHLTQMLSESGANDCFLVLFYVPWCPFSAKLAPIYNALPKAFPNLDIIAFDVSKSIGYNTKFGTSAVPMILIFKQRNALAKFNYTQKNLTEYIDFIANKTGFAPNRSIVISDSDFNGPVPTVPAEKFDYYLFISWWFVVFVAIDFLIRKSDLKLYIGNGSRRFLHIAQMFIDRFLARNNNRNVDDTDGNLAIDQQAAIPALMPTVNSASSTTGGATTLTRRATANTTESVRGEGGYNYRPRRNLHSHDE